MEKTYKNLGYVLLLLIPFTFFGFYKTYFNQFPTFEDTSFYIHLHATIASGWILMLIAQPLLIRKRKYNLHRLVGRISYLVFPLLILSFIPGMINLANSEAPTILFFPLSDVIMLLMFYSLAIYHRRMTAKHMRYMIGAALVFLDPTLGRIGIFWVGLSDKVNQNLLFILIFLILIGLIMVDRKKGKDFTPYLIILSMWILHISIFNVLF